MILEILIIFKQVLNVLQIKIGYLFINLDERAAENEQWKK